MMRASMRPTERIFCACAPGLEAILAAELAGLGLEARAVRGGAAASGEDAAARPRLPRRGPRTPCCSGSGRARRHGLACAKRAAARRAGGARLEIRAGPGRATISVDAAGAPLFRRGWRARIGAAPLRETLAAGILLASRWDGDAPFLDPMCGSGTLAIEAALIAARRAPGPRAGPSRSRGSRATTPRGPRGSARASPRWRGPSPCRSTPPTGTPARCGSPRRTPPPLAWGRRSISPGRTRRASARPPEPGSAR